MNLITLESLPGSAFVPKYPDGSMNIGPTIRRLRDIVGMSQFDLSLRSTVNSTYISSVENGGNNLSIKKVYQIGNALGIPAADIIEIQARFELSASLPLHGRSGSRS